MTRITDTSTDANCNNIRLRVVYQRNKCEPTCSPRSTTRSSDEHSFLGKGVVKNTSKRRLVGVRNEIDVVPKTT
jgi:hypothetical protein